MLKAAASKPFTEALLTACEDGNLDDAKKALDQGANIKAKDGDGITPLSWASMCGNTSVAELLLKMGAGVPKCRGASVVC